MASARLTDSVLPGAWWGTGLHLTVAVRRLLVVGLVMLCAHPGWADNPSPNLTLDPARLAARYDLDFRGGRYDYRSLRIEGSGVAISLVKLEANGLAVRVPRGTEVDGVSLCTNFGIRGDCQVIASYEIINASQPKSGPGIGLEISIQSATNGGEHVRLSRRVAPATGNASFSGQVVGRGDDPTRGEGGSLKAAAKEGRLCLVRSGPTVYLYAAEGTSGFQKVSEGSFGTSDIRFIRLSAMSEGAAHGFGIRWKDLTVRAESLPRMPGPHSGSALSWEPLTAGLCFVLVTAALTGIYRYRRVEETRSV